VTLPLKQQQNTSFVFTNSLTSLNMEVANALQYLLEPVVIEGGASHYAEPYDENSFLKMPANAMVNLGYVLVSLYWLYKLRDPKYKDCNYIRIFYIFSSLCGLYSGIQFMRIITQERIWGILDQWITLPFFSYVTVWNLVIGLEISNRFARKTAIMMEVGIVLASFFSYFLAVMHPLGFEVSLTVHIIFAVLSAFIPLKYFGPRFELLSPFFLAILSCTGFVILKVMDHSIPLLFNRFSGHFWSKICDFLQIHFSLQFFNVVYLLSKAKVK